MKTITIVYRNLGSSVLPQLVNIVSNLILPGMIILAYGSATNGLVSTVKALISYISLVGSGVSVATTQSLYQPVAQKDIMTIKGMMKATENMFNKCGWIYIAIVGLVSFAYPFFISGAPIDYYSMVVLMLVISISGASEFFVVGKCRSLLYANQKVYVCTSIQALSLLVSLMLAIIMLKAKVSIILVQFGISFVYIMRALLLYLYVRKNYAECIDTKDIEPITRVVEKRKSAMIHQLTGLIVFGSQTIILTSMVSLEAASIYAVYNIVFSGIYSICSNLNVAVSPFLGKTYALGNIKATRKEYDYVDFSVNLLCVIIFSVTALTILPFIGIYTTQADINYVDPLFAILFVIVQTFNVRRLPCGSMINGAGHFKQTQNRAIIEATICCVSSVLFTYFFDIYGVLLGTGLAIGWRCLDMITYSHWHILHNSAKHALFRLLRLTVYVCVACWLTQYILIPMDTYLTWFLYALAIFIIALMIAVTDSYLFDKQSSFGALKILHIKK